MDSARFDTWTRRRFGLAVGALSALLLRAPQREAAGKKRKKRCKKSEKRCGKKCVKGKCCPGKACQGDCQCTRTIEGVSFCKPNDDTLGLYCMVHQDDCAGCSSSEQCENGFKCIQDATFGDVRKCQPPCGIVV